MSNTMKNVIVGVLVVLISGLIIWGAISVMSELGFTTDNQIDFNRTLKVTFRDSNRIDLKRRNSKVDFSIVNNGTLDMRYDVLVDASDVKDSDIAKVTLDIDGVLHRLINAEKYEGYYVLYTGTLRNDSSSSSMMSHSVLNVSENAIGGVEILIKSNVSNDLATEVITSLNYNNNRFGLSVDEMNNVRYVGDNPSNYVRFNNELWRIIGVFNVVDSMNASKGFRVKLVRDESLGERVWSDSDNLFENSSLYSYLNDEYYQSIEDVYLIDVATYKIAELTEVSDKSQVLRLESKGVSVASSVSIPTVSDYMYASGWMDRNGWLLASNSASTQMYYYASENGSVMMKKYNERAMVSPVVYLKSTVRIVDGDGSLTNPFVIK